MHTLELGAYPAIEALGFVACEMRERAKNPGMTPEDVEELMSQFGYKL